MLWPSVQSMFSYLNFNFKCEVKGERKLPAYSIGARTRYTQKDNVPAPNRYRIGHKPDYFLLVSVWSKLTNKSSMIFCTNNVVNYLIDKL